jgi:hypothetical protein
VRRYGIFGRFAIENEIRRLTTESYESRSTAEHDAMTMRLKDKYKVVKVLPLPVARPRRLRKSTRSARRR